MRWGKIDKMRGLSIILSLFRDEFHNFNNTGARMLDSFYHMTLKLRFFCYEFYKFNNTGARMLDSIYHITSKLLLKSHFGRGIVNILPSFTQRYNYVHDERHYVTLLISKPVVVCRFYNMALYHSQRRRYVIHGN